MRKIIRYAVLLLAFVSGSGYPDKINDAVFTANMIVSDVPDTLGGWEYKPGDNVEVFSNQDEIIYYEANIGVINPTKKKYRLEIICIDSKGKVIIQGVINRSLDENKGQINEYVIRGVTQTLGLDPKPGALVAGQLFPLESGHDYFIQLYFEKKLIGVTKFHYVINRKNK